MVLDANVGVIGESDSVCAWDEDWDARERDCDRDGGGDWRRDGESGLGEESPLREELMRIPPFGTVSGDAKAGLAGMRRDEGLEVVVIAPRDMTGGKGSFSGVMADA